MTPRRHLATAIAIWAVLSVLGVAALVGIQILPIVASQEAVIVDRALVALTVVSVPVLVFVVVGMLYSAIHFRAGNDDADGPPIHGHRRLEAGWVLGTLVMVIGLAAYGTIGLLEIRGDQHADLEVQVHSKQWAWEFEYPDFGLESEELILPVGRRVHITIVSSDAIHSLSVPAFGIKQDAVPGRVTELFVTPNLTGTYGAQCAELCGLGHTRMLAQVTVMEPSEFDAWVAQKRLESGG